MAIFVTGAVHHGFHPVSQLLPALLWDAVTAAVGIWYLALRTRLPAQRALESSGRFEVVGRAGNGREAVAVATEQKPDLTLLDLAMPLMDGLEALPLIREQVPECTVVVLSGSDAETMVATARERGAAGYLVTGISPARLVEELLRPLESIGFLAYHLCEWAIESLLDTVQLLTTEPVANAVIHARSEVTVTARLAEDRLRVEVADTGGGALSMRRAGTDDTNGRGPMLMEALSSAWGTSADGDGKLVWFELQTADAAGN